MSLSKHSRHKRQLIIRYITTSTCCISIALCAIWFVQHYAISKDVASAPISLLYSTSTALSGSAPHVLQHDSICEDSCNKAKNGVCDDGSLPQYSKPSEVLCDLGTDCSDCGPWKRPRIDRSGDSTDPTAMSPVSFILSHNATVLVATTSTQPTFKQPITSPDADPDVSAMVYHYGALEGGITRAMHEVLRGRCTQPAGGRALVLDVGANMGYFAIYAALHGCRVIAWEPVPLLRAYLRYGLALNGVEHLVTVRAAAVGAQQGGQLRLATAKKGTYWGLASVDALNLQRQEVGGWVAAAAERLDAVVSEDVLLLKADVEGYEAQVVQSAKGLIADRHVWNLLLEYSPGIFERRRQFHGLCELPQMLLGLTEAGYRVGHLPQPISTPWPPVAMQQWHSQRWPALEEVSKGALAADVEACRLRVSELDGHCPVPSELKQQFPVWAQCAEWAYATHPKGFRSSFGFNTNVWASKEAPPAAARLQLSGVSSLFSPDQDMALWRSVLRPGRGTGMVECSSVGAEHKVVFRCPCGDDAPERCLQQRRLVERLAAEGRMPFTGSSSASSGAGDGA